MERRDIDQTLMHQVLFCFAWIGSNRREGARELDELYVTLKVDWFVTEGSARFGGRRSESEADVVGVIE